MTFSDAAPDLLVTVVVTVGSDHHPFDRLVAGTDRWAGEHLDEIDLFVQFGTAAEPHFGDRVAFLPHAELMAWMERADIIVTQGGPMGIIEAGRLGRVPIVMPRLSALGEVVDDHQLDLCRHLSDLGDIWLVEDIATLHATLDRALVDPRAMRFDPVDPHDRIEESVKRFAELAASLPSPRRRMWGWLR